jgi:hypothetical protein
VNKLLKSIIAFSTLAVWVALPGCTSETDPGTYLQQEFSDIQQRTIPPNSRLINQHAIAIEELGASAGWEFESNYVPEAYGRWVTSRLQPDFQVRETANSRLRFSKEARGDVEMLSVETVSSSGTLHIIVKLEIYPD